MTLVVLDTDHLSLYQRGFEPLLSKLLSHPPDELAITIITIEEQLRGRLAQIRKATTAAQLSECYLEAQRARHLKKRFGVLFWCGFDGDNYLNASIGL